MFAKIFKFFAAYQFTQTDTDLEQLRETLKKQIEINNLLKEQNFRENYKKIEDFIARNKEMISSQVEEMKTLSQQIKTISQENNELIEAEKMLTTFLTSKQVNDIVEQIKLLDVMKIDTNFFLSNQKTYPPS